jgi:hypothetical protein
MALQPFVGPWPLLQFRTLLYTVGRTPWTSDQPVARPLPTHRTTQTQNNAHRHPAASAIWTHDPSVPAGEDGSCLRLRGHCDWLTRFMGTPNSMRILYNTSLLTESHDFLKSTNSWCAVSLYSHLFSSISRIQEKKADQQLICYHEPHTDNPK